MHALLAYSAQYHIYIYLYDTHAHSFTTHIYTQTQTHTHTKYDASQYHMKGWVGNTLNEMGGNV